MFSRKSITKFLKKAVILQLLIGVQIAAFASLANPIFVYARTEVITPSGRVLPQPGFQEEDKGGGLGAGGEGSGGNAPTTPSTPSTPTAPDTVAVTTASPETGVQGSTGVTIGQGGVAIGGFVAGVVAAATLGTLAGIAINAAIALGSFGYGFVSSLAQGNSLAQAAKDGFNTAVENSFFGVIASAFGLTTTTQGQIDAANQAAQNALDAANADAAAASATAAAASATAAAASATAAAASGNTDAAAAAATAAADAAAAAAAAADAAASGNADAAAAAASAAAAAAGVAAGNAAAAAEGEGGAPGSSPTGESSDTSGSEGSGPGGGADAGGGAGTGGTGAGEGDGGAPGDGGGGFCVVEGTQILLADGSTKTIEEIKTGDMVLGYSLKEKQIRKVPVLEVLRHDQNDHPPLFVIATLDTELEMTGDHRLLTPQGWKRAENILPGDILFLGSDGMLKEKVVVKVSVRSSTKLLYTIRTETENYFANGILIHTE